MEDDIAAWEAAHETELELEREMYPEEDFNPRIKKKLLFDDEPTTNESVVDEASSNDTEAASLDIDIPTSAPQRAKQSRQREDETTPPKSLNKRSRVAPIRHSAIPLAGSQMKITGINGRRVFVELNEEETRGHGSIAPSLSRLPSGQLLSTPIDFLMASLESQARNEALRGAEARRAVVREKTPAVESDGLLWVDKYSPKSFQELLSDEKTNREVLGWLKEWDRVVFGTSTPAPPSFVPAPSQAPYARKQFTKDIKADSPTSSPTSSPFTGKGGREKWRSGSRFEKKENTSSPSNEKYKNSRYGGEEGAGSEAKGAKANGHTSPSKYGSYASHSNASNNGMPQYKAVLLCGPPGLGKTTLAHVLARHAGYNPVEINASDDRKQEVFENRVYAAVAMQSVLGDKKPNCLIIDEIDGVEGRESNSAIDLLVKLITAEKKKKRKVGDDADGTDDVDGDAKGKKKSAKNAGDLKVTKKSKKGKGAADESDASDDETESKGAGAKKTKGGKRSGSVVLQRPIICICNDMYVPALRKLRNVAKIFHFTKPLQSRITSRLKQICQQEGIVADTHSLTALVELTNHDTRSCLHTLQFLKAKSAVLTPALLASSSLGMKDRTKGLFDVWHEIFGHKQAETSQRNRVLEEVRRRALASSIDPSIVSQSTSKAKEQEKKEKEREKERAREGGEKFDALYGSIIGTGEVDKVTEGCFENYLPVIHSDHMLDKSQDCLDWLIFGDAAEKLVRGSQHFELMKYEVLVPMAFAYKASAITAPSIYFPKAEYEVRMKSRQYQSVVRSFLMELPAELRSTINEQIFVLDYISYFLEILGPALRPVNPQLLNESEKATLARLVDIMASHKLTYVPDREGAASGGFPKPTSRWPLYKLEPPIDTLAQFSDRAAPHALVPHQLRHMLVSQITAATIHAQHEELTAKTGAPSSSTPKPPSSSSKPLPSSTSPSPSKPAAKPLPPKKTTHVPLGEPKDFFGRPITKAPSPPTTPTYRTKSSPPSSPASSSSSSASPSLPSSPSGPAMRYKFNEGFSNAVRRTVYVKDFL
eukprot:Phypoly_transcript_01670.p1 GENE.Phypoly_transcript_01670~~Phypoly_transcript_01670.p1  ORF type:complete len:1072 (-),score=303.53 Phypoly_transcript_01670:11-3154(-)